MDLLQFFSSIAWQMVFVLFLFSMIIFRKSIGKFLSDFKSVKIGKDGLELQTKIENIENKVKEIEAKSLLSDTITERKHEIEALLAWEQLNILLIDIITKQFGILGLYTAYERIDWLKDNGFIDSRLHKELKNIKDTIEQIDSNTSELSPDELKRFNIKSKEIHASILELADKFANDYNKLYRIELANQTPVIEEWIRLSEKLAQIIRKFNYNIYEILTEQSDNEKSKIETTVRDIILNNKILSEKQLDIFMRFRALNKRISYFDKKAIEEYKAINIDEIRKIQKEIYEKLTNIQ
jgi:hypothetical protein